jgi:hypothetical protein
MIMTEQTMTRSHRTSRKDLFAEETGALSVE